MPADVPPVDASAGVDWQAATATVISGTRARQSSRGVMIGSFRSSSPRKRGFQWVDRGVHPDSYPREDNAKTNRRRVEVASVRHAIGTQDRVQPVTRVPRRMPAGEIFQARLRIAGKRGVFQ